MAFGLWLRADVFRFEFSLDDYAQLAMLEGRYPAPRSKLDLYTFSNGTRADVQAVVDYGFYPWFTHPQLRLSMLRPLASALSWLDLRLFGHAALAYHLHSALWWCALLGLLAAGFRGLFGARAALLALLLFTVDESHSVALGWISNRNALISLACTLAALHAYRRFREQAAPRAAFVACGLFCVALGAGEYALCLAAYAFAYEACEARGQFPSRLRGLALWAVPGLVYLAARSLGGFGAYGSDMYLDPLRDLGFFLRHGLVRLPVLCGDIVWGLPSDWWTFGLSGWTQGLIALGLLPPSVLAPDTARALQAGIGAVGGLLAVLLAIAAVRGADDEPTRRRAATLALGAGLSLLPLLAGFPTTRALLAPSIGYWLVLSLLITRLFRPGKQPFRARAAQLTAAILGVLQLSYGASAAHGAARDLACDADLVREVALRAELTEGQRVVLLNAGHPGIPIYLGLIRSQYGRPAPASHWTLNPSFLPYWLTRSDARTLELEPIGGSLLTGLFERVFRTAEAGVRVGQEFSLPGLKLRVLAVSGGGISRLRAEFDRPLEDPRWSFLIAGPRGMERYVPPAIGQRVFVPPPLPPSLR
ncbi:MAG TPA: hypothetical protein VJV78_36210 [Polyangiales bacterium]|nr:hypothetical protein [Polyangiales bacterium]